MLLVVSGSARRVEGDRWAGGETAASAIAHPTIQFLKRLYLQQLAVPCPSGMTYDPNSNPHCHRRWLSEHSMHVCIYRYWAVMLYICIPLCDRHRLVQWIGDGIRLFDTYLVAATTNNVTLLLYLIIFFWIKWQPCIRFSGNTVRLHAHNLPLIKYDEHGELLKHAETTYSKNNEVTIEEVSSSAPILFITHPS
jgi:hypothetical protein